jgi:hypothetical protein
MSIAATAPHSVDSKGIPPWVVSIAAEALRHAGREQATRRLRWRMIGADDWIGWYRGYLAPGRSAAAQSIRRIRAAALAEGIPPRILWALARGES